MRMTTKISKIQLEIYQTFGGDIDGFSRISTKETKNIMDKFPWSEVNKLIQSMRIIKTGLASKQFASETLTLIDNICDDSETSKYLQSLA